MQYLALKARQAVSSAKSDIELKHFNLWLAFIHFYYRQWDGFMELVCMSIASTFSVLSSTLTKVLLL